MSSALDWFNRFLWFCSQPIKSLERDEFCASLRLRWQWLKQHLLQLLHGTCSKQLLSIARVLDAQLGFDDSAVRLHRGLLSRRGQPPPVRDAIRADILSELLTILEKIELDASRQSLDDCFRRKVALWTNEGERIRHIVSQITQQLESDTFNDDVTGNLLLSLKQLCAAYDVRLMMSRDAEAMEVEESTCRRKASDVDSFQVALRPLTAAVLKLAQIRSSISSNGPRFSNRARAVTSPLENGSRDTNSLEHLRELINSSSALHKPITWLSLTLTCRKRMQQMS